jgi:hypothetical protein
MPYGNGFQIYVIFGVPYILTVLLDLKKMAICDQNVCDFLLSFIWMVASTCRRS